MAKAISKHKVQETIEELQTQKLGLEARLESEIDAYKKDILFGKIAVLNDEIESAELLLQKLQKSTDKANDAKDWSDSKDVVVELIEDYYMGYFPKSSKIWYCENGGTHLVSNPQPGQFHTMPKITVDFFKMKKRKKYGDGNIPGITEDRVRELFLELGKAYTCSVSSFNKHKWDDTTYLNQMTVIRDFWAKPKKGVVDQRLEFLFHCVGDAKLENIEHLEKWILIKHQHPELSANIPNLDIGGGKGGSGKGALITLLKTIFTNKCVIPADASELIKFNGGWGMATIAYFDEGSPDTMDADALKKSTGAEERRQESKGQEAIVVDSCENKVFTSNNPEGVVPLTGESDAEDRRYSILYTGRSMIPEAMKLYGLSKEDAKLYVHSVWTDIIKNRDAVEVLMGYLYEKYGDVTELAALHGQDYNARFEKQKPEITKAFDLIFPVLLKNGVIATEWVWELVKDLTENDRWKRKTVTDKFETYLKNKNTDYELKNHTKINVGGEEHAVTQSFRILGNTKVTPYQFDWRSICTVAYNKHSANKLHYPLSFNHSTASNKVVDIAAIMNRKKVDMD